MTQFFVLGMVMSKASLNDGIPANTDDIHDKIVFH
jgi:hypothetical protein